MRRFGWIRTICVCVVATFMAITGAAPGLAVSATSMPTATVGVSRLSVSDRFALGLYRAVASTRHSFSSPFASFGDEACGCCLVTRCRSG